MTNNMVKNRPTYSFIIGFGDPKTDVFGRSFDTPEAAREAMDAFVAIVGSRNVQMAGHGKQFVKDGVNGIEIGDVEVYDPTKPWKPDFDNLEAGFECLVFHRGKWRHVYWAGDCFMLSYGGPHIAHAAKKYWAPLPERPADGDGFMDWSGPHD